MSVLNLYPTVRPTLSFDFVNAGVLDPSVTFTRPTSATYFDETGILRVANPNTPRFDFNPSTLAAQGLLIEEARTNLVLRSEDFATTWFITGTASVSTNAASSPAATTTADKFILGNTITSGNAAVVQTFTKAASATTYTVSVFVKAAEFNSLRVILRDTATAGNNAEAYFNANTGTIASAAVAAGTFTAPSATISNIGSGWYRVTLTCTTSTETSIDIRLLVYQNGTGTATGNGTDGILFWGAQLEAGAFPTSYIPTTTTALTRSADVASVNTLSPWYNATAGTLYAEFSIPAATASRSQVTFGDGTSNERMIINNNTSLAGTSWRIVDGGVDQAEIIVTTSFANNATVKVAGAYTINDFAMSQNGGTVGTDTSGTLPTVTTLYLGSNGTTTYATSYLRRITYYPVRLTNAQLQNLTA
jgi:hypothetical protein